MASAEKIRVSVACALPEKQVLLELTVAADATIETVIRSSGILEQFPGLDLGINKVGVYGKLVRLTDTLHDGDRVEIYRPLIADPKQVRKQRAAEGKVMKKGAAEQNEK